MKVQQRELWLIPFPFSDFSGKKVRPVLILSKDSFNDSSSDIIVCGITSTISKEKYSQLIMEDSLEEGVLYETCSVKFENLLKIDKALLIKKIGKLKKEPFFEIIKRVPSLFS